MTIASGLHVDELSAALRHVSAAREDMPAMDVSCVSAAATGVMFDSASDSLIAMSLGTSCLAAWQLGVLALRSFAGPFDWVFSSPTMVQHALNEDFKSMLDASFFEHFGDDPLDKMPAGGHKVYSGMLGRKIIFNHHDLRDPADLAYFGRAVTRLLWALRCPNPKLFVIANHEHSGPLVDEDVDSLFDCLLSRCIGQLDLVVVKVWGFSKASTPAPARQVRRRKEGDGVLSVHELRCRGHFDNGIGLKDPQDQEEFEAIVADSVRYDLGRRSGKTFAHKSCHLATDPLKACVPQRIYRRGRYRDDGYLVSEKKETERENM